MAKKNPTFTNPTNTQEAYDAVSDEIAAVADESLRSINVDIPRAINIVAGAADRLESLALQMKTLPINDFASVLKLRTYAAACLHAHLVVTRPFAPDPTVSALLAEGYKLRARLLNSAELLVEFGEIEAERVAAIRSGTGHTDMANDLVQLADLYGEHWNAIKGMTPVSREMIERAAALGWELRSQLGARGIADHPFAEAPDAQTTRLRAFTLLARVYDECRRAVIFLRWHDGDADAIAPSLYTRRARRSSTQSEEVEQPQPEAGDSAVIPIEAAQPIVLDRSAAEASA
jgi:hypothetical protein